MIYTKDTNFGAIEAKQKDSDFELGAVSSQDPIPESYMTPYSGVIYHQHKTPACGAHAGAYIKNIQEHDERSPEYLWKRIKQIDGFKPEDGTSMEAIFKTLQKRGVCTLSLMPNNSLDALADYTDPKTITQAMDDNAVQARIGAYAFAWKPSMDQLKRAIYEHKAVVMLLRVGYEWWTPSWNEKDILPLKPITPATSGHFVDAIGYDKDYIYFLNEWGDSWGRKGIGYFGADYMPRCIQIGTCFDYSEKAPNIFARTLKVGMKGTDVGVLQQALKDKGYFPSGQAITSYYGQITFAAVKSLQKAYGLVQDGIAGARTFEALKK